MQARFFDPVAGRFLSTDPIGYQDQFNLYAYVANDPVNRFDPNGESWQDVANITIGTVKVVVGSAGTAVGAVIVAGSGIVEVGTGGVATPAAVPAAIGGATLTVASVYLAADGGDQIAEGVNGLISENVGKKDAGKNDAHGDGGRAIDKGEEQIKGLEGQKAGATKKERKRLQTKIDNIKKTAQSKKRGENHSQKPKK